MSPIPDVAPLDMIADQGRRMDRIETRQDALERSHFEEKAENKVHRETQAQNINVLMANVSAIRGGVDFFRTVFQIGWKVALALLAAYVMYGEAAVQVWRHTHP